MTVGKEINLLKSYPKSNRDISERAKKSEEDRTIARRFDQDFFDGDRRYGYGGYKYNPIYWTEVTKDIINYWSLDNSHSLLDVGCGKGFMLFDFKKRLPLMKLKGIDISSYAIKNAKPEIKHCLEVSDAKELKFDDRSFDFIISINTIHNLEIEECINSIKEIERVKKIGSFIMVDAYNNLPEKQRMMDWNLTAKTILSVNYTGDYFWFIP